jgi:predicted RNase H-like HicB family nuclease
MMGSRRFFGYLQETMGIHERQLQESDAVLICVARGHEGDWEAFCLDFDLAVQGDSLMDVRTRLEDAIGDYVQAALAEDEPARTQLLNRRAPFSVRFYWALRFFIATIFGRNRDSDSTVGFPVSCHA